VELVELAQAIGRELSGRSAILDGEIVRPGPDGRPMFYELMRRRARKLEGRLSAAKAKGSRTEAGEARLG
jgi:ATP-dependent DNA ligase